MGNPKILDAHDSPYRKMGSPVEKEELSDNRTIKIITLLHHPK
jgi:hypothetical protein